MESIIVELTVEKLKVALEKAADELFKNSYSNPVKDILEKSIKEKEGEIKKIIDSLVAEAIGKPEFREKLADVVVQRIVESALKK